MTRSSLPRMACILAGAALVLFAPGAALAGPTSIAGPGVVASPSAVIDVRVHRRVKRRGSAVPGAVLGLFGAALGAAIASDRYDNYSYYSYGYPSGYGYAPVYGGVPYYGGPGGLGVGRGRPADGRAFGGGRALGGAGRAHVGGHVGHR